METDQSTSPVVKIDVTGLPSTAIAEAHEFVDSLRKRHAAPTPAATLPLRGRFAHLNISIGKEEIDAARKELWQGFPRGFDDLGSA